MSFNMQPRTNPSFSQTDSKNPAPDDNNDNVFTNRHHRQPHSDQYIHRGMPHPSYYEDHSSSSNNKVGVGGNGSAGHYMYPSHPSSATCSSHYRHHYQPPPHRPSTPDQQQHQEQQPPAQQGPHSYHRSIHWGSPPYYRASNSWYHHPGGHYHHATAPHQQQRSSAYSLGHNDTDENSFHHQGNHRRPSIAAPPVEHVPALPEAFLPPRHIPSGNTSAAKITPDHHHHHNPSSSSSSSTTTAKTRRVTPSTSKYIWEVSPNDVLCGRGAPSNFHHGNQLFRNLIKDYQTVYLCAKRSDKPRIATKVMELIKRRGGRFLRRVKPTCNGSRGGRFAWEEIGEQRSYEKVCQGLRDGAPELRRQMLASTKIKESRPSAALQEKSDNNNDDIISHSNSIDKSKATSNHDKENSQRVGNSSEHLHYYTAQQGDHHHHNHHLRSEHW